MRLKTLGGLALEPATLTRPKPLLLLTFLNIEGSRSRRDLAELFWPGSKDPMQNLRTALSQINKDAPEAIQTDEKKIWTELKSDYDELQARLERDDFEGVLELYQGTFLEGFSLDEIGEELEEWIFQNRERVAGQIRDVLLGLAQGEAAKGAFDEAARYAEEAYLLRSAPEPDVELLTHIYTLLRAGENPQAESVAKEAKGYDLTLSLTSKEAKERVQRALSQTENVQVVTTQTPANETPATQTTLARESSESPFVFASGYSGIERRASVVQPLHPHPIRRRKRWRVLLPLTLLLVALFVAAFIIFRPQTLAVRAGNPADDVDVALTEVWFCPDHANLFLSSNSEGQATALRFRDIGITKPQPPNRVVIQSAFILFTSSEHLTTVPEGSGFVVHGLFDSSPWIDNRSCETPRTPAGENYVSRVRTQTSVTYEPQQWNINQQYSLDVRSIVQEIVNSPDWTVDGIAFAIDKLPDSTANLKAYSNEGGILLEDLAKQPQFVVTFTTQQP
jgi:DNA-binding SARP family transcriptional activator